MGRILAAGLALLVVAGFIGYDSFAKLAWPHVHATVLMVEPQCEMKSEQYNGLTRTTSTATIDCDAVEPFKILHPDKEWTVHRSYLAHLKVPGANPVATSMVVYSEPAPKPAQVLDVIQDPKDPLRVLKGDASASGFGAAGLMLAIAVGLVVLRLVLRAFGRPAEASRSADEVMMQAEPAGAGSVPVRAPVAARPSSSPPNGRVFGRR